MAIQTLGGIWSVRPRKARAEARQNTPLGDEARGFGQRTLRTERGIRQLVELARKAQHVTGAFHAACGSGRDAGGSQFCEPGHAVPLEQCERLAALGGIEAGRDVA